MRQVKLAAALLLIAASSACATLTAGNLSGQSAPLNVLFIGNSLTATNDLPGIILALMDSAGAGRGPVTLATVAYPNFGLEDHWRTGEARQAISGGSWDLVVLQQGPSATEGRPSLLQYSEHFAGEIRARGARPALSMVWPARARFFDFAGVSESYRMAAERVDGLLLPVGDAWRIAWAADSSFPLYGPDGFHPSKMGSYLAGLVMFGQFTGRSTVGLPSTLSTRSGVVSLDPESAAVLQAAAEEAIEQQGSRK